MRLSANPILEVRGIFPGTTNAIKIMEERFIVDNQMQEYKQKCCKIMGKRFE